MPKYQIFETTQFSKDLAKLAPNTERLHKKLQTFSYPQLKENPHFGNNIKKLKGYQPDTWRYRIGNYRFFYEIDEIDKLVLMTVAENRKKAF